MTTRNERLKQFFGGYFHQDWDINGPTWRDVIKQCFTDVKREEAIEIRDDLAAWLAESAGDSSPNLPPSFGCDYEAGLEGLNDRQWVQEMVSEFDRLLRT
jgi:hypothetical protein